MVMVSTSESSQCRAVAAPCAWKARRRGCAGESRGGSVVLQRPVQHLWSRRRGRMHSPPQRVQDVPNHAAPLPDLRACLVRGKKGPRWPVEVCDGRGVDCGARERGVRPSGAFMEQARARGQEQPQRSSDRLARRGGRWRRVECGCGSGREREAALRCIIARPSVASKRGAVQSRQVGRYPGVTRTHAPLLADHSAGESACELCRNGGRRRVGCCGALTRYHAATSFSPALPCFAIGAAKATIPWEEKAHCSVRALSGPQPTCIGSTATYIHASTPDSGRRHCAIAMQGQRHNVHHCIGTIAWRQCTLSKSKSTESSATPSHRGRVQPCCVDLQAPAMSRWSG
jgi:hypothetical protein